MILTCCCLQGFWETGPCPPFYTNRQNCPSWSASFDMQFDLWLPPPFLWLLPRRDDDLNELGEAEQPRVTSLTTQLPRILCSFTTLTAFPSITGQENLDWPFMNNVFGVGSSEDKGSNVLGKSWPQIVRGWGSWKSDNSNCRASFLWPLTSLGFDLGLVQHHKRWSTFPVQIVIATKRWNRSDSVFPPRWSTFMVLNKAQSNPKLVRGQRNEAQEDKKTTTKAGVQMIFSRGFSPQPRSTSILSNTLQPRTPTNVICTLDE